MPDSVKIKLRHQECVKAAFGWELTSHTRIPPLCVSRHVTSAESNRRVVGRELPHLKLPIGVGHESVRISS